MIAHRTCISLAVTIGFLLVAANVRAAEIGTPQNDPVLTVNGQIERTNEGDTAVFDMDMLKALPATSFRTSTIWTDDVHRFTGVALDDLLDAVGAQGRTINAIALNDYAVEIPAADAVDGGPIVAYEMDGAEMSVREKGPLWIVYPYDAKADYRTEMIYSRSIWQLDRMNIR